MKITILAAPEVRGVLTDAFSSELDTEFTTDDFCRLDCDSSEKGLVESLAIALLTEAAVELFRKIVARKRKRCGGHFARWNCGGVKHPEKKEQRSSLLEKWAKNNRVGAPREGRDLSHHRAYRSVHGGSTA